MVTILTGIVFLATYALIVTEKIPRAVAAAAGASVLVLFGVLSQETAIHHIDWNTLGLLIGMMIIVDLTKRSGVFGFLAIWVAKNVKADPVKLMLALSALTAVLSAFLDNVTTVLLVVPVTLAITVFEERFSVNDSFDHNFDGVYTPTLLLKPHSKYNLSAFRTLAIVKKVFHVICAHDDSSTALLTKSGASPCDIAQIYIWKVCTPDLP